MGNWFLEGDILLVDRGYRDAISLLNRMGVSIYTTKRKTSLNRSSKDSRLVTKSRWVIESHNDHFQVIFKFFDQVINMQHDQHLKDFHLIAGAIINYIPRTMLARYRHINFVQ